MDATKITKITPEMIAEMREWLVDAFPSDPYVEDEVADCTDKEIVRAVERYYDGGLASFIAACQ